MGQISEICFLEDVNVSFLIVKPLLYLMESMSIIQKWSSPSSMRVRTMQHDPVYAKQWDGKMCIFTLARMHTIAPTTVLLWSVDGHKINVYLKK